ncbi:MAG TPA: hypothetical protein DEG43_07310 [Acidimicrobiaceae bacterium]|nr:hypothetical protein [Acidimicrobiaceae bacterium]
MLVKRERPTSPLALSVEVLRHQLGLGALSIEQAVATDWSELVGDGLASVSEPLQILRGELVVEVQSPTAAEAMKWATDRLIAECAARYGPHGITAVRVKVRATPRRDNFS